MKCKIQGKKGIVDDWLPLLVTIVALVFVIFFVYTDIAKEKEADNLVKDKINEIDSEQGIVNFLRMESNKGNMADLIVYSTNSKDINRDFQNIFQNIIEGNLDNIFSDEKCRIVPYAYRLKEDPYYNFGDEQHHGGCTNVYHDFILPEEDFRIFNVRIMRRIR